MVGLTILSCTTIHNTTTPLVTPIAVTPVVHRGPIVIQFCSDVTTSYPRDDFQKANQLIASSLIQAVQAGEDGVTLYATAITHNTFDPANTLNPPFQIPAIQAYPVLPTIVPTAVPQNPVSDSSTATAVASKNSKGYTDYNQAVQDLDMKVQQAKTDITTDVARLTSWSPPADNTATSIYGCLELARDRFADTSATRMIYIASDLENNTSIDQTQALEASHGLNNAIVHVIFFYSDSATRHDEKVATWCNIFHSAGAKTVLFDDPSASLALTDLVNRDTISQPASC